MGKLWRFSYACIAVQLLLLWSYGSAQVPGFLSIDCGSNSKTSYIDINDIEWTSDAALMKEGEALTLGDRRAPYSTSRVFTGNELKYCYSLSNSAVIPGAFFLVRAWFWTGTSPPYIPKSSNGHFRFMLLIDADEWTDVDLENDSTNQIYFEMYTRALRNSIDVCLARSAPDGDDPFISALELRPLPSSLSATRLMKDTNLNFVDVIRKDDGADTASDTRYPADLLDRLWSADTEKPRSVTLATIDTSKDQDRPPVNVLQTAFGGTSDTGSYVTWTISNRVGGEMYYCVMYFAEIDTRVNASGQREFNILLNGETVNAKPIDVFREVGANTSYEFVAGPISVKQDGIILLNLSATSTSLFSPFFAGKEFFQASSKVFSNGTSTNDVTAIDDLKTNMSLSSYTGDPCLPTRFGYSWLTCTSMGVPRIISISLSNHIMGGRIPESINTLTMLNEILLDGNGLEGSIPDMSALTNLQTLNLSNNKLNGFIPESLATLKNLKVL